ncbi:MAG: M50 family metallopeptidase [Parachlamydiales bacterium]|jgi:Zn-dependent protease
MLSFKGAINFRVHPFFWILAGLIGYLNGSDIYQVLIWVAVIFLSVSVHELGHAVTALAFRQKPSIELVAMGGVTSYTGRPLKFWQQFLVVFNGPLFGLLLFCLATLLLYLNLWQNGLYLMFLEITQVVNLFWTVVNLLPVLPLDGGQLMRIFLEGVFGLRGYRFALFLGMLFAVAFCVYFFLKGGFLIGALFFLFAFQSFDLFCKARLLSSADRSAGNAALMREIEKKLEAGNKDQARALLEELLQNTGRKGLLALTAIQELAVLYMEAGEEKRAYELLLTVKKELSDESRLLLHQLAFKRGNYALVAELSSECYRFSEEAEVALANAKAFAFLGRAKPSGGWLYKALEKAENWKLEELLKDPIFQSVKEQSAFREFF